MFAVPVKEKDAESTCAALIDHVFRYTGVPKNVYSDRGSEFTNDLSARLSTAWGFKWRYVTAYSPESNGKIERVHRPLKAALQQYCRDNQHIWDQVLPSFVFSMNNTVSRSLGGKATGASPNLLVYGQHLRIPEELVLPNLPEGGFAERDELIACRLRVMAEARHYVMKAREAEEANNRNQDAPIKTKYESGEYQKGDLVFLYVPQVPNLVSVKLFPMWQGPYTVIEQVGALTYRIQGKGKTLVVHVRRLMRFNPMLDRNETVSEAIQKLDHELRVPPKRRDKSDEAKENPNGPLPAVAEGNRAVTEESKEAEADPAEAPEGDTIAPRPTTHLESEQEEKTAIEPKRSSAESKLRSAEDVQSIHWHVGKMYLVRPPTPQVADECLNDFFLMKVREWEPETRTTRTRRAAKAQPPVLQFYRSHKDIDELESRTFYPVYLDSKQIETFWPGVTDKSEGYTAWQIKDWPRMVLDFPFDLQHGRIPLRVWDEIEAEGIPAQLIGAPPPGTYKRAKLGQAGKRKRGRT